MHATHEEHGEGGAWASASRSSRGEGKGGPAAAAGAAVKGRQPKRAGLRIPAAACAWAPLTARRFGGGRRAVRRAVRRAGRGKRGEGASSTRGSGSLGRGGGRAGLGSVRAQRGPSNGGGGSEGRRSASGRCRLSPWPIACWAWAAGLLSRRWVRRPVGWARLDARCSLLADGPGVFGGGFHPAARAR